MLGVLSLPHCLFSKHARVLAGRRPAQGLALLTIGTCQLTIVPVMMVMHDRKLPWQVHAAGRFGSLCMIYNKAAAQDPRWCASPVHRH